MIEVKFSQSGDNGRSKQVGKISVDGDISAAFKAADKVIAASPPKVQKAIVGVTFKRLAATASSIESLTLD